jgi:hypothetical protein
MQLMGRSFRGVGALIAASTLLGSCGSNTPPVGGPIEVTVSFGEVGTSPGQFSKPRCMDSDGESLWVIDFAARVQRLDPKTGEGLAGWTMPEFQLGKPTGITAWRPEGAPEPFIFIADTHYHRIVVYAFDGGAWKEVSRFGEYGEGPGQFIYPTDILVLPDETGARAKRVYVAEYGGNDRITIFDVAYDAAGAMSFTYSSAFGRFGSGPGVEFARPQSMSLDETTGTLVLVDACNHRLGVFTTEGELVRWISGPDQIGVAPGQMTYPYGLALPGDGSALVVEFGSNRLQRFDLTSGRSLGIFGQTGRGEGELSSPWAAVVVDETAYVLDSGNNRVIGFDVPRGGVSRVSATGGGR